MSGSSSTTRMISSGSSRDDSVPVRRGRGVGSWPVGPRVLVIDNYDSFVYHLVQYLGDRGAVPVVHRHHDVSIDQIGSSAPDAELLSPGPGRPEDAGVSTAVIERLAGHA